MPTPTTPSLPTRTATATVWKIEADLLDITSVLGEKRYLLGHASVTARVGITDYTWQVSDATLYTIGQTIDVEVPA